MDFKPAAKKRNKGKSKVKQTKITYQPEGSKRAIVMKVFKRVPKNQDDAIPDETA